MGSLVGWRGMRAFSKTFSLSLSIYLSPHLIIAISLECENRLVLRRLRFPPTVPRPISSRQISPGTYVSISLA